MKSLIVEDDFNCRRLMMYFLLPYGDCDVAVDSVEALEAFQIAWEDGKPYDLICLDIMMPRMDGQTTLKQLRALEQKRGITGLDGVKIIMTTGLGDNRNILEAFNAQCEAYLIKPFEKKDLLEKMYYLGLIEKP